MGRDLSHLKMDTEEQTEEQPETQQSSTPAPKRRGRQKKVREEGGGGAPNAPPSGVMSNVTPPTQPLASGFWMGLLTTQRERRNVTGKNDSPSPR